METSVKLGKTIIITNAAFGWVEASGKKFLPSTYSYILKNRIEIISARQLFEDQFPNDFSQWKLYAFMQIIDEFKDSAMANLVAIGDNQCEIDAAIHLSKQLDNCTIKTIKFREGPSCRELTKQLKLVGEEFEAIVT